MQDWYIAGQVDGRAAASRFLTHPCFIYLTPERGLLLLPSFAILPVLHTNSCLSDH
jgi:hypothetical protein